MADRLACPLYAPVVEGRVAGMRVTRLTEKKSRLDHSPKFIRDKFAWPRMMHRFHGGQAFLLDAPRKSAALHDNRMPSSS